MSIVEKYDVALWRGIVAMGLACVSESKNE